MKESENLKSILVKIINNTYENTSNYVGFQIVVVPKELKSKHGVYQANSRRIEIYNLARAPGCTMLTCLHEVAHHIHFMDTGELNHKKKFYEYFYKLIITALSMGLITINDLEKDKEDSNDYSKLISFFGPTKSWSFQLDDEAKKRIILISNGYSQRETLKKRGYQYYAKSQSWGKEFSNSLYASREARLLNDTFEELEFQIVRKPTLLFSLHYYIGISGAYEQKTILKKNGYRWEAYGIKSMWVKKVATNEFYQEEIFLKDLRLIYKRVTPKQDN